MLGLGWAGLHLCDVGLRKHSDRAASKASFSGRWRGLPVPQTKPSIRFPEQPAFLMSMHKVGQHSSFVKGSFVRKIFFGLA